MNAKQWKLTVLTHYLVSVVVFGVFIFLGESMIAWFIVFPLILITSAFLRRKWKWDQNQRSSDGA